MTPRPWLQTSTNTNNQHRSNPHTPASRRPVTGRCYPAALFSIPPAMNPAFLDFEQPIAELEAKIQELRFAGQGNAMNIEEEIGKLKDKCRAKTQAIFANLSPWQIAQLARHRQLLRPIPGANALKC